MLNTNLKLSIKYILCSTVIFSLSSCSHDPQILEEFDSVCFETQIQPLISSSCAVSGCHDANTHESGYNFTNYESIFSVIEPGNARQSKLYQVLTDVYAESIMPPDQPLSIDNRNLIKIWIEQGAKNTTCSNAANLADSIENIFKKPVLGSVKSDCHYATKAKEGYLIANISSTNNNPKNKLIIRRMAFNYWR